MSLKAELETWSQALDAYDAADLATALKVFRTIAESSKVYFNIGLIHATLGDHKQAIQAFKNATELDRFFAAAYFQRGVSLYLIGEWDRAKSQFESALTNMRGNDKMQVFTEDGPQAI
jgi:tetratricopeptide (TPR) repeat protein